MPVPEPAVGLLFPRRSNQNAVRRLTFRLSLLQSVAAKLGMAQSCQASDRRGFPLLPERAPLIAAEEHSRYYVTEVTMGLIEFLELEKHLWHGNAIAYIPPFFSGKLGSPAIMRN